MNIARTTRKYGSVSAVLLWLGTCSGTAAAAPGDLDPTFGASGRISFDLALEAYYPPDLSATAQSDGRIVAVGTLSDADSQYSAGLFLARFEPDGSPDLTFGNGGVIGNTPLERGRAVIQQADGQLVAVGDWLGDIALLRVDGLGFADPAFGAGGIVRTVELDPERLYYDSTSEPHHHFYNVDTGELTDIPADCVSVSLDTALPEGTVRESVDIVIRVRSAVH
jgi:hypothetical protein